MKRMLLLPIIALLLCGNAEPLDVAHYEAQHAVPYCMKPYWHPCNTFDEGWPI